MEADRRPWRGRARDRGLVVATGPPASAATAGALPVGCGGQYSTIGATVKAATAGATIDVCKGTYNEDVAVDKAVTLVGQGAIVDAAKLDNGFDVSASGATIEGFTVEKAIGEDILVAPPRAGRWSSG